MERERHRKSADRYGKEPKKQASSGQRACLFSLLSDTPFSPLEKILGQGALKIAFQPIFNVKQKRIIGLEALARPDALSVVSAFAIAQDTSCLLELDRHCREQALASYAGLRFAPAPAPKPLLFLNFEASVVDRDVEGSGMLLQATRSAGVDPQDVVIEINESLVRKGQALSRFVEQHRSHGFLIALDDLGAGHSNLARIAQLQPHILKLDRSLISGLNRNFMQQQTVKALARLGKGIGALVLAEGVETLDEVDCCTALGIELFQGYVFSKPLPAERLTIGGDDPRLLAACGRLRQQAVSNLEQRHLFVQRLKALAEWSKRALRSCSTQEFAAVLASIIEREADLEAVYLLDGLGQQIGATHLGASHEARTNRLFAPSGDGTDHSYKDYFYSLVDTGLSQFTTDRYLSLATGNLCRTVTMTILHRNGCTYVLCLDITERT
jgi:EAL domain-containing protein (putative c-di-GMP-specific phosphodiesterase class I)